MLNDSAGVTIEVEGQPAALEAFERALAAQAPPLARIDSVAAAVAAAARRYHICDCPQPGWGRAPRADRTR